MHTENSIVIRAQPERIFRLACAVERWPELLAHYRSVREISRQGDRRVVEMAAHRDGIPVRWRAEQICDPAVPRITFRHVRGVTTGMEVEWSFTPTGDGVLVRISHELRLGWPVIGGLVADRIIGPFFIANIAGKTLRRIKQLAEANR
ncbi:MAG TPA: SRPBCC family protein [Chloroflexota bacterium]|jgi:ribosome-associated toxin RatA of RatAB toxin-antitoxin module|nr:SRPBCC family protein [Chloroflexota bacterium]